MSTASGRSSGLQRVLSVEVWCSRGSSDETNQRLRFSASCRLALELVDVRGPAAAAAAAGVAMTGTGVLSALWEL